MMKSPLQLQSRLMLKKSNSENRRKPILVQRTWLIWTENQIDLVVEKHCTIENVGPKVSPELFEGLEANPDREDREADRGVVRAAEIAVLDPEVNLRGRGGVSLGTD